jgi:alanine racemase
MLTKIEISKSALKNNIRQIKQLLAKNTKFMAVVKSNAYGHGLFEVVNAIKNNVDYLTVFSFEDAILMRKNGIKTEILVLCRISQNQINQAIKYNLIASIASTDILKIKKPLRCHICIDTGLGRDGFVKEQMIEVINACKNSKLKIEGLYAHFATADEIAKNNYTQKQIAELLTWQNEFKKINLNLLTHHQASAGAISGKIKNNFNIARIGISLYGCFPSNQLEKNLAKKINLKPALTWKTKIIELRKLKKGAKISYNCTYQLKKDSLLATLPVGYFDGFPRLASNNSFALINGQKCPQIGRVTMNLIVIDVSHLKNVKIGDEAVLIGKQKSEEITATTFGSFAKTNCYEALTRLNSNIKRQITK